MEAFLFFASGLSAWPRNVELACWPSNTKKEICLLPKLCVRINDPQNIGLQWITIILLTAWILQVNVLCKNGSHGTIGRDSAISCVIRIRNLRSPNIYPLGA